MKIVRPDEPFERRCCSFYGIALHLEVREGAQSPYKEQLQAIALRADGDGWTALVKRLMQAAPRWSTTAAAVEQIASQFG